MAKSLPTPWIEFDPEIKSVYGSDIGEKKTDPAHSFPTPWIVFPRSEIPQNNFERFFKPYIITIFIGATGNASWINKFL